MKVSVEQLNKYGKGNVKEFPFLAKVTDYIAEKYPEIKDDLDIENLEEIINREIKPKNVVFYSTPEIPCRFDGYIYVHLTEEEGVISVKSNLDCECIIDYHWDRSSKNVKLEELYYVTDEEALKDYVEKHRQEKFEKYLEELREEETKRREQYIEEKALRIKYELKNDDFSTLEAARAFEKMNAAETDAEKLRLFTKSVRWAA